MEIQNKVIIVTGASHGIGLAVARLLSKEGARVILAARSGDIIIAVEKELPGSFAVMTDMRKPDDIKGLIAKTLDKYGRIDVLINNAGQGMYGPVENIDLDNYREIMELNVYAPLLAMQAVIPQMRKQGGGIILNVSSKVSKNYFPNLAAYASTKYALNALSLTARQELAKDKIIVSVMHPKMTATDFGKNSIRKEPETLRAPVSNTRPGDRPGMEIDTPEQVAQKIYELIKSEESEAEM
jgi:short-subunit dehydrogenase